MGAEKKRPRGLAAQKAAKKAKTDTPEDASNAQTVVLDKMVEEGDEVGEAAALFESAMEKAGNLQLMSFYSNRSARCRA